MDPLSILGLTASIVQLVHITAHTSKLLKSTCDRIKNAPECVRETHQYVQRLEVILRVIAEERGSDVSTSEKGDAVVIRDKLAATAADAPGPMDEHLRPLFAQTKHDLEELGKEIEELVMVFADDSASAAGPKGIDASPTSASGAPTSTTSTNTATTVAIDTPSAVTSNGKTVTKKFKQAYDRSKGRVKAYFKDDRIQDLKRKIEGHVSVFTFVFSAEARSHSRRSAQGTDHIRAILATYQQQVQQLEIRQQFHQEQLLITQAFAYKMLESGSLDAETLSEYRKLNLEPSAPSKDSRSRTLTLPSWTKSNDNGPQTQSQDLRIAQVQKKYRRLGWKWSVHQLGIGRVSMATSEQHITTDYGLDEEEYDDIQNEEEMLKMIDLTVSMPWISPRVLKASLCSGGAWFSGFSYEISMPMFNSNPDLLDASRRCDVHKMRVLFARKQAHPTDLLAPWGKSLLHEAVLSYAVGKKDAMKMCELLISMLQGKVNVRSMDGRTPLLLCCKTSAGHSRLLRRMEPLTRLLLANGADMSLQDANGQSSAQLLFTSGGVSSIKSAFLQRVGIVEFQDMNQLDSWMFTSLARVDTTFKATLEHQLRELRTDPSISGDRRVYSPSSVLDMSIAKQVKELKEADPKVRSVFMRAICAHGTPEMLEPLLRRDIDPNEEFENDNSLSYLGEAAFNGNLPNIEILLKYGADINGGTRYRPIDAILERWAGAGDRDIALREQPILERLLAEPDCWSADAVTRAIYTFNDAVVERLLQAGFGRNDSHPCVSLYQFSGCEAIETIQHRNISALKLLVKYKRNLDYTDFEGYTALLQALDKGYSEFVEVLLKGNADVRRKAKCGLSAWDLVNKNRSAQHPRRPVFEGSMGYTDKFQSVDEDTDQKMYEMVRKKMMQTGGLEADGNSGWISHTANTVTNVVHRDIRADFDRFRVWLDKNPPSELLFVTSALALTFFMFLLMQAYETLWWIFRAKKPPRARDVRSFVVLAGAWSVYWWMTSRGVRELGAFEMTGH